MAMHYDVSVFVDGINRTSNTVLPLKIGNFLDERLDECNLSIRAVKKRNFAPLTPVEIKIKQTEYFYNWNDNPKIISTKTNTLFFVVANDSAVEFKQGSGLYNHDIYLIEPTKIAECYVVDTLTFTNDLGRSYTKNAPYAISKWE